MPVVPEQSPGGARVEVRRSSRRRRTVTAYRKDDTIVVLIPARLTRAEERRWVTDLVAQLEAAEVKRRRAAPSTDMALQRRAVALSDRYLAGRARPASVRWVTNQQRRWGSCTPRDATIRLSDRVQQMPGYVLDYVLVHELVHLLVPGHGPEFWAEAGHYPLLERARGYLEGVEAAAGLTLAEDCLG